MSMSSVLRARRRNRLYPPMTLNWIWFRRSSGPTSLTTWVSSSNVGVLYSLLPSGHGNGFAVAAYRLRHASTSASAGRDVDGVDDMVLCLRWLVR